MIGIIRMHCGRSAARCQHLLPTAAAPAAACSTHAAAASCSRRLGRAGTPCPSARLTAAERGLEDVQSRHPHAQADLGASLRQALGDGPAKALQRGAIAPVNAEVRRAVRHWQSPIRTWRLPTKGGLLSPNPSCASAPSCCRCQCRTAAMTNGSRSAPGHRQRRR